jgi:hypothetical protein
MYFRLMHLLKTLFYLKWNSFEVPKRRLRAYMHIYYLVKLDLMKFFVSPKRFSILELNPDPKLYIPSTINI